MSLATATSAALPTPSRPPLARLVKVELRKTVDTRSGFWLLLATVGLTLLVVAVAGFTGDDDVRDFSSLLQLSLLPVGVLLPILGILGMTAEFSQRTALQTFTAVPRRERIVAAKTGAVLALGAAGFLVCVVLSLLVTSIVPSGGDIDGVGLGDLGQGLLYAELSVLVGLGFGMLFRSPALAIVVYFVAPTVFSVVVELVDGLHGIRDWLDQSVAWEPLTDFTAHGDDWGKILTAALLWLGVPIVLGLVLLRRREVS